MGFRPDFLAEPQQLQRVADAIASCAGCQRTPARLCRVHRRILPKGHSNPIARLIGEQSKPGALSPEAAKRELTRTARQRKRAIQMARRSGIRGLVKALAR